MQNIWKDFSSILQGQCKMRFPSRSTLTNNSGHTHHNMTIKQVAPCTNFSTSGATCFLRGHLSNHSAHIISTLLLRYHSQQPSRFRQRQRIQPVYPRLILYSHNIRFIPSLVPSYTPLLHTPINAFGKSGIRKRMSYHYFHSSTSYNLNLTTLSNLDYG